MGGNVFLQLAFILGLSSFFGIFLNRFKLPLIIAYLLTGVIMAALPFFNISHSPVLEFLPEIGISFLLFMIGMELDLSEIRTLGKPIIVSSVAQIIISTICGYIISSLLGFNNVTAMLIGVGLAFSSTIVVIKNLLEKKDLNSLYGKLAIGILLVEDLVAIIVLMVISVSSSVLHTGLQNQLPLLILIIKIVVLFLSTFILSKYVLAKLFAIVAKSVELLFLTALTWCFVFTTLATMAGFSVVIGAFLAGLALAQSPYHYQIQSRIKPLRDFFVVLFFVYLGAQVNLTQALNHWMAVMILTFFTLFAKPVLFLLLLGSFGFRKHTLFQTSLNLSQISEFSLVVLLVGIQILGAEQTALSVLASVGVISIIISSVFFTFSRDLYRIFGPIVKLFEHQTKVHFLELKPEIEEMSDHVVLIGAHRMGGPVVKFLQKEHVAFCVIDLNPHLVQELTKDHITAFYGDAGDPEILDLVRLDQAKLIISTSQDMNDNEIILKEAKHRHTKAILVMRALDSEHSKALRDLGADFVITPETLSGDFLVTKIRDSWLKLKLD